MTYRQQLRELAFDTHGVVTTRDAQAAGVPAVELRKLAARGALAHLGHGVYRMLEAPTGRLDEFAEAVAMAGEGAVLADESVLAALDLAQVNLRRIRVVTPRRMRAKLPVTVEVIQRVIPDGDCGYIEGIPAMTIEAALRAARGRVMTERLIDATRTAAARGLLSPGQEAGVIADLVTT
ncbi:MAG: type IV toxin-antitoxin system AbiEi family antitoxin domain-containing protein [Actinomycetota bacterium]|nr:type IV toxin-antitoxin system AbiEi family antitoxin domain-containing protein [Actinomycetota bacterium]